MGMGAFRNVLNAMLRMSPDTLGHPISTVGGPIRMRKSLIAGVAILSLYAGQAAADICADPQDQVAVKARTLQTELMVAALRCDSNHRYNAFVRKFESDLVVQGRQLRTYFTRSYGSDSERRLNRFVTFLANAASLRSVGAGANYCKSANALFADVMGRDEGELAIYAATHRVDVASEAPICNRVAALIEQ
mgnify:CR=1 FL=1|jgi:hypothetical protein